jgi:hypothetical protein
MKATSKELIELIEEVDEHIRHNSLYWRCPEDLKQEITPEQEYNWHT